MSVSLTYIFCSKDIVVICSVLAFPYLTLVTRDFSCNLRKTSIYLLLRPPTLSFSVLLYPGSQSTCSFVINFHVYIFIFNSIQLTFSLISRFSSFSASTAIEECGRAGYNIVRGRIVGGRRSTKGAWPWMAALYRNGMLQKLSIFILTLTF